jgi:phage baseplate assembly protein W
MNLEQIMEQPSELDDLLYQWALTKKAERDAAKARVDVEEQILALVGSKPEGSETHETEYYRITVTGNVRRSVDAAALAAVQSEIPQAIFDRVFKYEPKLDLREMRYVQNNEPGIYSTIAQAITAKPGKPTIKVEEVR